MAYRYLGRYKVELYGGLHFTDNVLVRVHEAQCGLPIGEKEVVAPASELLQAVKNARDDIIRAFEEQEKRKKFLDEIQELANQS